MTDPSNPYASLPPGGQAPTWQAPQYGHSQPGYDQAPYGYGQGAYGQAQYVYGQAPYGYGQAPYGYGQPVYGQPGYVAPYDSRYDGMRTQAIVAIVLSVLSWFLFHIFMSVPAMIWAIILAGKARGEEVPSGVRSLVNAARLVTIIMVVLQLLIVIGIIALFMLYPH